MDFSILSCERETQSLQIPRGYNIGSAFLFFMKGTAVKSIRKKVEEKYKWDKFLYKKELLNLCEKEGQRIRLPYTQKELLMLPKEGVREKIQQVMQKEEIKHVVVEDGLEDYVSPDLIIDGSTIKKIFLKKWIEFLVRKHQLKRKNVKFFIIDGEEKDIIDLLSDICEDVNHMTVCTNRIEYFEDFFKKVYETTGLMIECVEHLEACEQSSDLVIDFEKMEKKVYRIYPRGCIVIDMAPSTKKTTYLSVKRTDIHYYYQLHLKVKKALYTAPVIQAAILEEPSIFLQEDYVQYKDEVEKYGISVQESSRVWEL